MLTAVKRNFTIEQTEGREGEQKYSCTFALTSALDKGEWSVPPPGIYPREREPVPNTQEAVWDPRPVWTGAENLAPAPTPTGIRSPGCPARSESLYRLGYLGPMLTLTVYFTLLYCKSLTMS